MNKYYRTYLVGGCLVAVLLVGCGQTEQRQEAQEQYINESVVEMAGGDYETALKNLNLALENAGGTVGAVEIDCNYRKAVCYYHLEKMDEAIGVLEKVIGYNDKDSKSYFLMGSIELAGGDTTEALTNYNKAINNANGDFDVYIGIYEKLKEADMEEEAKSLLYKAEKLEAKTVEQYCQKGRICLILEDYSQGKLYLDKAINGGYDEAKLYMASLLEATDQGQRAQTIYESYAKDHQGEADIQYKLGQYYLESGKWEDAITYYKQAMDGGDSIIKNMARLALVKAYEYTSEYEKAYQELQIYVKENPKNEEASRELIFLKTRVQED